MTEIVFPYRTRFCSDKYIKDAAGIAGDRRVAIGTPAGTVSVLTIRHQVKHGMTDNAEDLTATGQMRDKLFQESTETATYGSWGCRSTYGKAPIAPTRGLSSKVQTPGAKARE